MDVTEMKRMLDELEMFCNDLERDKYKEILGKNGIDLV